MNHIEFERLKNSATTRTWDWISSKGDTLKEKFMTLYELIMQNTMIDNGNKPAVVCNNLLIGTLICCAGNCLTLEYKQIEDVVYVGKVANVFCLYQDCHFTNNEILIDFGNKAIIIKILNNPLVF